MKQAPQKPQGGRKAPLKSNLNGRNRKGDNPAAPGVYAQKKKEAYKSIPKAKRVDARFGKRKAPGSFTKKRG